MTGDQNRKPALVDAAWLAAHKDDPDVCLIEIDRFSLDQYESGHIEGRHRVELETGPVGQKHPGISGPG